MAFYVWLLAQRGRLDDVGRFAFLASTDHTFPKRSHRLYKLLRWAGLNPELRTVVCTAHREWRVARAISKAGAA